MKNLSKVAAVLVASLIIGAIAEIARADGPAAAAGAAPAVSQQNATADANYRWDGGRWWYHQPAGWVVWNGSSWVSAATQNQMAGTAPIQSGRRYSYVPNAAYGNAAGIPYGAGGSPMTVLNNSYSRPFVPFKKADSKILGTNDY
jgi:hypothetical protein